MLGSVISKRWVVSLALVGLVSVFMASYSAVWADPASATTTVASEDALDHLIIAGNTGKTVTATANGQDFSIRVAAQTASGGTPTGTITYLWSYSSGSGCGSLSDETTDFATFTAGSATCTAVISVHAQQNGSGQKDGPDTTFKLTAPAPLVAPPPIAILPPLSEAVVEGALSELSAALGGTGEAPVDVGYVSQSIGGSIPISSSSSSPVAPKGTVKFPPNAISIPGIAVSSSPLSGVGVLPDFSDLSSALKALDDAPVVTSAFAAATGGTTPGSFGTDISIFDIDGNKLENFRLEKPAEICLPYTAEDLDSAYRGIDGMAVWHLGESGWVRTNSSVDLNNQVVCGYSSTFSPFVIGLDVAPPETGDETGLPATGDYAPGYGNLMLVLMAGIALVATGGFAIRRSRRVREDS